MSDDRLADTEDWARLAFARGDLTQPELEDVLALVEVARRGWRVVEANYDTAGGDVIEKKPVWDAIDGLHAALAAVPVRVGRSTKP